MIIYGIGMPKTGTKTLKNALDILGLKGSIVCVLNDCSSSSKVAMYKNKQRNTNTVYRVENDMYKHIHKFPQQILQNNKFIFTKRDVKQWRTDVSMLQTSGTCNTNEVHTLLKLCPDEYEKRVDQIFLKYSATNNLLKVNMYEEKEHELWWKICNHIGVSNTTLFPPFPILK